MKLLAAALLLAPLFAAPPVQAFDDPYYVDQTYQAEAIALLNAELANTDLWERLAQAGTGKPGVQVDFKKTNCHVHHKIEKGVIFATCWVAGQTQPELPVSLASADESTSAIAGEPVQFRIKVTLSAKKPAAVLAAEQTK